MLKILRRIVQEVNAAHDFGEALQIMVNRVREAIETQACTVFLVDKNSKEFVLMATDGLNPGSIGKIRLQPNEGLVGLIGEREEPLNLENAPSHLSYSYRSEVGEERFKAFLGAPIIHHRRLFGVIVVQQEESRRFDEAEEAFLVTMSAQLAGIIAHAEATGAISALLQATRKGGDGRQVCLEGIGSSPGVGVGMALVVYPPADLNAVPEREAKDIDAEIEIFNSALAAAREDVKLLAARLAENLPEEEQALFDVYLRILESSGLGDEVIEEIKAGQWAQGALKRVIKKHVLNFEALENSYLRERATDVRDLGLRILSHLQERQQPIQDYPEQTILISEEITAAAMAEVPEGRLAGVVSVQGSSSSHVAILSRALGIPCVMGVDRLIVSNCPLENKEVIVDGYYGQVYVSPTPELRQEFLILAEEERELDTNLAELHGQPAVTLDGHMISLFVNTGLAADAGLALSVGAEGVGLYRSEVPFMVRDSFPTEEEQRVIYRQLLKAFAPRPVVMRTLDIGGDKILPYFPMSDGNSFLGWRGIRVTLDHPDVFLIQLRAMLKASEGLNNLRILLPMITSMKELHEATELLLKAHGEVIEEGVDIVKPQLGVMIEVPSAVYQIDDIAKLVDFISVGSNDLTQYLLAVDRSNARVASLYDALHPAVLRALSQIVTGAHMQGKLVSICGEMGSDPASVIVLMAMGFDVLSMSSVYLPRVKWVIRSFSMTQAKSLLDDISKMDTASRVRYHLEQALDEAGLGGLIRAGK